MKITITVERERADGTGAVRPGHIRALIRSTPELVHHDSVVGIGDTASVTVSPNEWAATQLHLNLAWVPDTEEK